MMKKIATLAAAALLSLGLVACAEDDGPEYRQACITQDEENVVPDVNCEMNTSGYMWYYYPYGWPIYSVGSHVSGGTHTKPKGKVHTPVKPVAPVVNKPVAPVKPVTPPKAPAPPAPRRR